MEKLEGSGRTSRNAMGSSGIKHRKKRESLDKAIKDGLSIQLE